MPNDKDLTWEVVKRWILSNSEDQGLMDNINKLTYPFTSKYGARSTWPEGAGRDGE